MSSDSELASIVAGLRFSNCVSLAVATVVTYDYIITFPKEINYVWNRPWSFVTVMFFVVRYVGLFVALTEGLYGNTFIPGPVLQPNVDSNSDSIDRCTVLLIASDYAFIVFLAAADIMMILRVYAMFKQSKIVLGFLLVLYAATIILYTISAVFYNNLGNGLSVTTVQILDMSFCNPEWTVSTKLGEYKAVPRLTLAALLLALVIVRLGLDTFQEYKESKRWEANRYIRLFAREGILYFLAHVLNNVPFGETEGGQIATGMIFSILFVLSPRFVMSVRALHMHNLLDVSGQCSGIDTGFGFGFSQSQPPHLSSAPSIGSASPMVAEGSVEMQRVEYDAGV